MRLMRDFVCDCGKVIEKLVDSNQKLVDCECGLQAKVTIGTPTVKLEGITGDFPGAHDKWARVREQNAKIKAKKSYVA